MRAHSARGPRKHPALVSIEEAREHYRDVDAAHGFDHVLRVLQLCERIGAAEGADLTILRAAALLHDIAREAERNGGACHAHEGAKQARLILRGRAPQGTVEAVADAIVSHRFRAHAAPRSLEGRVLYDADKLDAIGAIGVARVYAVVGAGGQPLCGEAPGKPVSVSGAAGGPEQRVGTHSAFDEFVLKLSRVKDGLYTRTGTQLARERHAFMMAFFERLDCEVRGEA